MQDARKPGLTFWDAFNKISHTLNGFCTFDLQSGPAVLKRHATCFTKPISWLKLKEAGSFSGNKLEREPSVIPCNEERKVA
jgi:hypothetical protein